MGLGGEPSKNNLKPVGVRKSGLVPHVLAKPVTISKPPAPPKEKVSKPVTISKPPAPPKEKVSKPVTISI